MLLVLVLQWKVPRRCSGLLAHKQRLTRTKCPKRRLHPGFLQEAHTLLGPRSFSFPGTFSFSPPLSIVSGKYAYTPTVLVNAPEVIENLDLVRYKNKVWLSTGNLLASSDHQHVISTGARVFWKTVLSFLEKEYRLRHVRFFYKTRTDFPHLYWKTDLLKCIPPFVTLSFHVFQENQHRNL